jgi:hypothetical protein
MSRKDAFVQLNEKLQHPEYEEMRKSLLRTQRELAKAKSKNLEIVEAVYQAARDAALASGPASPAPIKDKRKGKPEVALLHTTDWQLGKVTADYNMEMCEKRLDTLVQKTIDLTHIQRADHPVEEIVVMFGGDMVEGITVFPGQAYEVEAHLFTQLFECARLIERIVLTLANHFRKVTVWCEYGNHGRIGRRGDVPYTDNIDRVAYRIAADRLKDNKRVEFHESENWHQIVTIGNYKALLFHGDEIKSFGGNTPAFGILRKVNAWATGVVAPFNDAYHGHFHTPMTLTLANGGRVFGTGSPESENVYAAEFVAAKGRPSQRLHFVDPVKGRVTSEHTIWLD